MLDELESQYESAELTCVFLYDKEAKVARNILSIIEMIPSEQRSSKKIHLDDKDGNTFFQIRENIPKVNRYTLYFKRCIDIDISTAINIYRSAPLDFILPFEKTGDLPIGFFSGVQLIETIPDELPLLIPSDSPFMKEIIPNRTTSIRLWSKVDGSKKWLEAEFGDLLGPFIKALGTFSKRYLGIDLAEDTEHLGNIYLLGGNPYLRSFRPCIIDCDKKLLLEFFHRDKNEIIGGHVEIAEVVNENIGFVIRKEIESNKQLIELPYHPNYVQIRIFSKEGDLLEQSTSNFIGTVSLFLGVIENQLTLTIPTKTGEEKVEIQKKYYIPRIKIGDDKHLRTRNYLINAFKNKQYLVRERKKDFIFFSPDEKSKKDAKRIIRDIINSARKRCMILDPYFGAIDLVNYVLTVENIEIPINIITSEAFLKGSYKIEDTSSKTSRITKLIRKAFPRYKTKTKYQEAVSLSTALAEMGESGLKKNVSCKVILGSKTSPLHDRYLVVDDLVYLLGSSLNEFGGRATTLVKIETPKKLIEKAESWWDDATACMLLQDFMTKIDS